jgi:UDP-N-acetylmuramate dehydrogenase
MHVAELDIHETVPLAPLTTMGVGGPARFFTRAESVEGVLMATLWAAERGLPVLVLGRGSNLLVADEGFPGLVLRVAIPGLQVEERDGTVEIVAGAGQNWDSLVARTVAQGWAGVECLSGIPGLVGSTPIQNVGAYGQEVSETITHVEVYDTVTRRVLTVSNATCGFAYRESRFKHAAHGRYIILQVGFRLLPGAPPTVHYIELERELAALHITTPTVRDVRRAVLEIRRRKSMVLAPRDPNARSAGSFFINPLLAPEAMAALDAIIAEEFPGQHIPRFTSPQGGFKIPAAWLIERAGFQRGFGNERVGLSSNHALAIVNRGGATTRDVLTLARQVRDGVAARFGVLLAPEPTLVGVGLDG